uniref:Uncharacterized protein n=1 Tax=Anguilla anguilla TaxID=7936 RepID=A0A0E9XFD4_ANGAN
MFCMESRIQQLFQTVSFFLFLFFFFFKCSRHGIPGVIVTVIFSFFYFYFLLHPPFSVCT